MLSPSEYRPTVDDLGAIMRARTTDENGNELGTFTTATRPTQAEADRCIDQALGLVGGRLGNVPDRLTEMALSIVCLRAAMFVETSYVPEDADVKGSAFANYEKQYESALADYDAAIDRDVGASVARIASVMMPTVYTLDADGDGIPDISEAP